MLEVWTNVDVARMVGSETKQQKNGYEVLGWGVWLATAERAVGSRSSTAAPMHGINPFERDERPTLTSHRPAQIKQIHE